MKELGEILKRDDLPVSSEYLDPAKRPARYKCAYCGQDECDWWWLNSECPDIMPSRWMRQQCVCEVRAGINTRRRYLVNSLSAGADPASIATQDKVNARIRTLTGLYNKLLSIKNQTYYATRLDLADEITATCSIDCAAEIWQVMFCTSDRSEVIFWLACINEEQKNLNISRVCPLPYPPRYPTRSISQLSC